MDNGTLQSPLTIAHLLREAENLEKKLAGIKHSMPPGERTGWYPYNTFSNLRMIDRLLSAGNRDLFQRIGNRPLLDIGTGDGDLAFLLEALGFPVHAIDHPATNFNQLEGIHTLKRELKSKVEIHVMDLDSQFALPGQRYGLACFLGILYHLKNPYYVLEALARRSEYCLLSTRIAQYTPGRKTRIQDEPVAYLLDWRQANDDSTNYWIFSAAGLRRIVERAGWSVLDFATTGQTSGSEPSDSKRDERAFCLLKSEALLKVDEGELLRGWYDLETGGWRWTEKKFSFHMPGGGRSISGLALRFYLPEAGLAGAGTLTLQARVNGCELPPRHFVNSGEYLYEEKIPASALERDFNVEFEVSSVVRLATDERELGLLVPFHDGFPLRFI